MEDRRRFPSLESGWWKLDKNHVTSTLIPDLIFEACFPFSIVRLLLGDIRAAGTFWLDLTARGEEWAGRRGF